nr:D7 protein [Aedes aegypti]
MKLLLLLAIFTTFSVVASMGPFDPEEMLFIFTRCMEDNLEDGANRLPMLAKWKEWINEPVDSPATQCFGKCVLVRTGLYDPVAQKFDASVIQEQFKAYPSLGEKSKVEAYANAVKQLPSTNNDCAAVFKAYDPVHKAHKDTSKNLFHGNKELTKGLYEKLGKDIRQKKQSYFEFCENKYYPAGSDKRQQLCQIRQYTVLDDALFKEHTDCVMKGIRYITKDNQLDVEEVKRDFKLVNKDTKALEKVLNDCKSKEPSNAKEKSWHYYKCLVESSVKDDFKEAFDYREVRSQIYAFNLPKKQAYSKPAVQSQVMEIDGKQCPQ